MSVALLFSAAAVIACVAANMVRAEPFSLVLGGLSALATGTVAATSDTPASPLSAVRLLLKETKTGSVAAKIDRLAEELGKSPDDVIATLVAAGLKVPEKPREKPAFVPHGEEILWLNRNAKGELWLNAKASKFADKDGEGGEGDSAEGGDEKPRRGRSKKKETE